MVGKKRITEESAAAVAAPPIEPSMNGTGASPSPTPAPAPAPDPFDPAKLRLTSNFASSIGIAKALLTVPVKKPTKEWFVRVHPAQEYRLQTCVLELKEEREIYLIDPPLWTDLSTEPTVSARALFTALSRQGVLFLWPIRLPGPDGKIDDWSRSSIDAANMATSKWVRVVSNMSLGAYEAQYATADLPEPEWPKVPFSEILRTAFKDRYISSLDHPVLRRLRGEI